MRTPAAILVAWHLLTPTFALADQASSAPAGQAVIITRVGRGPSLWAPDEFFTGSVRIDTLFPATPPAKASGASVTFEPGARTLWHTHPLGQVLIVTAGRGWVQQWGGPINEVGPGDVVWIPPGVKNWHGATATTAMTHIAIQESVDGHTVEMMEPVGDDQYHR